MNIDLDAIKERLHHEPCCDHVGEEYGNCWACRNTGCAHPPYIEGQAERDMAALVAEVERLTADLARTKRACETLGRVVTAQGRDVLDATGMHDVIGEDGDGDWAVVWERLGDLHPERDRARAERDELAAKVAAIEAAFNNLPIFLSAIEDDLRLTPKGRGGEAHFLPATPGHGKSGCPGDNITRWLDEVRAALEGGAS